MDLAAPAAVPSYFVVSAHDAGGESANSIESAAVPERSWLAWLKELDLATAGGVILMVVAGIMFFKIFGVNDLIAQIKDQTYARGLITFTVTYGTIVLAFVLVGAALFADNSSDDRFRRGREVFGVLAGVLGTIVGFYFGSADKDKKPVALSEIRVTPSSITAYAHGGTSPYRFSIDLNGTSLVARRESADGWISFAATAPIKEKDDLQVTVVDKTDQEAKVSRAVTADDLKPPAPVASPAATPSATASPAVVH